MFLSLSQRFIQEDGNVTADVNVFDGIVNRKMDSIKSRRANFLEAVENDGVNVASGKPTEVSSTFYNNAAGSAVDGNPDTFFHSDVIPDEDEYFQVDLENNYRVDRYVSAILYVYQCCVLLTHCTHHT